LLLAIGEMERRAGPGTQHRPSSLSALCSVQLVALANKE